MLAIFRGTFLSLVLLGVMLMHVGCRTVRAPQAPPSPEDSPENTDPSGDRSESDSRTTGSETSDRYARRETVEDLEETQEKILLEQTFTQALAYESLGDYTGAVDRYRAVVSRSEQSPGSDRARKMANRARLRIARIYREQLDDPEQAIQYYGEYLDTRPRPEQHQEVTLELARYYQEQKQFKQAKTVFEQFLNQYPDSDSGQSALYNLGIIHRKQDQSDRAIEYFQQLLESYPEGDLADGALYQMAQTYADQNKSKPRFEALHRILQNHPNSDLREYVMFQVVQLGYGIGQADVAQKWAETYLEEYKEGRFRKDIQQILDEQS